MTEKLKRYIKIVKWKDLEVIGETIIPLDIDSWYKASLKLQEIALIAGAEWRDDQSIPGGYWLLQDEEHKIEVTYQVW